MTGFEEFLQSRLTSGGFTTEDVLAAFLPLARQVAQAHADGKIAPLEGLENLKVSVSTLWLEESRLQTPKLNRDRLQSLERADTAAIEVVNERRAESNQDDETEYRNLAIGRRDEEFDKPLYFPGYVAWEHLINHHDPITDIYSLGLILASLACGLNFTEDDEFASFVEHRHNLFAVNPDLHPVLARAIARMTELDRHRRPQDLATLLRTLENYRDQEVDFDVEMSRVAGFDQKAPRGKQQVVLSRLRDRLFEISRRNRLLHYRATLHTVNLTHASIPLAFDVKNIRPDQILVWNDGLQKQIAAGSTVSLNKYLNFNEAVYLPSVLDGIRVEAQRDRNEYGFSHLRLVACFLRWANLKESPAEVYESPLVLIPVELSRKTGIRDTYSLKAPDSIAEINPVVRHLFKQLYDIELPETIDLEETSLSDLHAEMARRIEASDPAVSLAKIDRPRVDLLHDLARRRLDQYRKRSRLAGKGVRRFMDLDYCYDPANYHPLGLMLFNDRVRPPQTRLEAIAGAKPVARQFAAPAEEPPAEESPPDASPADEKRQSFFQVREGGEGNPYQWEFDLCSVTLGNFKYRKMSLVRDYHKLLDQIPPNPAFDASFSIEPREINRPEPEPLSLNERFHVVSCDPTQAAAIAESRSGNSYIIQGPPGTGKSQTITNLIADYVSRGKRVLFVCEKRAAIDVVFHRLKQKGLDRLCCLIHDSQEDKKAFVMNLKQTYEEFLAIDLNPPADNERQRHRIVEKIERELRSLQAFHSTMISEPTAAGVTFRQLLSRLIELRDRVPDFSAKERERLPLYAQCHTSRDSLNRFRDGLRKVQPDEVFARHPLRLLNDSVRSAQRPVEHVSESLAPSSEQIGELLAAAQASPLPESVTRPLAEFLQLVLLAADLKFLARLNLLSLLDEKSPAAVEFTRQVRSIEALRKELAEKQTSAKGWREKLSPEETRLALEQAKAFQHDWFKFLKPAWWRLRGVLKRGYDFSAHRIQPTWIQVLEWLLAEHQAAGAVSSAEGKLVDQYRLDNSFPDFARQVDQIAKAAAGQPKYVRDFLKKALASKDGDAGILALAEAATTARTITQLLSKFLADFENLSADSLQALLRQIEARFDEFPAFLDSTRDLTNLPREIVAALRAHPWTVDQLEGAAARRTYEDVSRAEAGFAVFNSESLVTQVQSLDRLTREWPESNAQVVCDRVRARFLEHVQIAGLSAAQLTTDQKSFKQTFNRGRRELEHEFGKSMRYRPIRDLVSGEPAIVVQDLKPVWLMSPLSVSDALPLDTGQFDVVIFDEASQIPLEEAVPSLFRATQAIVVGDEMQLPPTNFFSARQADDEGELQFEEEGQAVSYDLTSDSFLNHAARNLPSRMLGWHYRSRSESLISFSNWAFYGGDLLTVPEHQLVAAGRPELLAYSAEDGAKHCVEVLNRAVSFHFMQHGVYQKRCNLAEAEYIAELVRGLLKVEVRPTIGIVAFSEAQQGEIEAALKRLADEDREFRDRLENEFEREIDNQFAGLLVKNLENIQGDERDVIILSVCYAPDPAGKMRMNFGPINQSGGEKRLNVAFSRAKKHMALVSSIRSDAITNDYNDGANCLKNYLQYAESSSTGDHSTCRRVLQSLSLNRSAKDDRQGKSDIVVDQLAEGLRSRGFQVERSIGQSRFQCDIAIRREGDQQYRLGILVDTDNYYRQTDLLERDLMKPNLLRDFGWKTTTVLAKDWWQDPEKVLAQITQLADQTVATVQPNAESATDGPPRS